MSDREGKSRQIPFLPRGGGRGRGRGRGRKGAHSEGELPQSTKAHDSAIVQLRNAGSAYSQRYRTFTPHQAGGWIHERGQLGRWHVTDATKGFVESHDWSKPHALDDFTTKILQKMSQLLPDQFVSPIGEIPEQVGTQSSSLISTPKQRGVANPLRTPITHVSETPLPPRDRRLSAFHTSPPRRGGASASAASVAAAAAAASALSHDFPATPTTTSRRSSIEPANPGQGRFENPHHTPTQNQSAAAVQTVNTQSTVNVDTQPSQDRDMVVTREYPSDIARFYHIRDVTSIQEQGMAMAARYSDWRGIQRDHQLKLII